jgi:hypothetical protein
LENSDHTLLTVKQNAADLGDLETARVRLIGRRDSTKAGRPGMISTAVHPPPQSGATPDRGTDERFSSRERSTSSSQCCRSSASTRTRAYFAAVDVLTVPLAPPVSSGNGRVEFDAAWILEDHSNINSLIQLANG